MISLMFNLNSFGFSFNRKLSTEYISISIRSLILSMIGIFIPAYILSLGYNLNDIIIYYLIFSVAIFLFTPVATKFVSKAGLKFSIVASFPLLVIAYLLLYSSEIHKISIYWSLIPTILSFLSFWPAFHTDFASNSNKDNRGHEVGYVQILSIILASIGPILAAFIILFFGFSVLFITISILMLLAIIPLYNIEENYPKHKFNLKDLIIKKRALRDYFIFFSEGIDIMSDGVLWPLFIYLMFRDYLVLGYAGSLLSLSLLIPVYIASKYTDSKKRQKLLSIGSLLYSLSWLLRPFASTIRSVYLISIFSGISGALLYVPYHSIFYNKVTKNNTTEYIVIREMFMSLGRIFVLTLFYLTGSFIILFILSAIASFFRGFYK